MNAPRRVLLAALLLASALWLYTRTAAAPAAWLDNALALFDPMDVNTAAFLSMIRTAEHGRDDPSVYYVLFGGEHFLELDTHPAVRTYGEFVTPGVRDFTTAAGAYQETFTTWRRLCAKLGTTDFSQATQDAHAVELIREAGALDDVRAGRFEAAVRKVSGVWASLPFATVPQPHRSLDQVRTAYLNAGGEIVAA